MIFNLHSTLKLENEGLLALEWQQLEILNKLYFHGDSLSFYADPPEIQHLNGFQL